MATRSIGILVVGLIFLGGIDSGASPEGCLQALFSDSAQGGYLWRPPQLPSELIIDGKKWVIDMGQTRVLGSGINGGPVFRVSTQDGKTFVLKRYLYNGATQLQIDLRSLDRLRPHEKRLGVSVVKMKATAEINLAWLEDVHGVSLDKVIEKTEVPDRLKAQLRERYLKLLRDLEALAKESNWPGVPVVTIGKGYVANLPQFTQEFKNSDQFIEFSYRIHPENIVVDLDANHWTIIDPN